MATRRRKPPQAQAPAASPPSQTPPPAEPVLAQTKGRVIPTEPLFVHVGIALPLLNVYPAISAQYALIVCLVFVGLGIAAYWSILRFLRQSGLIKRLWNDQVLHPAKSRVSVGAVLSLLDHLHIVLVFGGVFLFCVNALYWLEPKKTWLQSLYMGFMAFNLKGFDDFVPESILARFVCASLSVLNVLFVGFLAAAFLKPFVIVFGHK